MTVLITTVLNTTISQGTAAKSNNAQQASANPTTATLRRSKADEIARRLSEATPRRCRNASCSRHNRLVYRPQYFPWDGRGEKRRGKKRSVGQSGLHRRVGGAWVNPNWTKNKIYVCVWGGVGERDRKREREGGEREEGTFGDGMWRGGWVGRDQTETCRGEEERCSCRSQSSSQNAEHDLSNPSIATPAHFSLLADKTTNTSR